LAVGNEEFIAGVKAGSGFKSRNRTVRKGDEGYMLWGNEAAYAILPLKTPFQGKNLGMEVVIFLKQILV
jgi:hypothetical protein